MSVSHTNTKKHTHTHKNMVVTPLSVLHIRNFFEYLFGWIFLVLCFGF